MTGVLGEARVRAVLEMEPGILAIAGELADEGIVTSTFFTAHYLPHS